MPPAFNNFTTKAKEAIHRAHQIATERNQNHVTPLHLFAGILLLEDSIVIPMDIDVHPGCTTIPESVEEVATDMYNQFCELAERQGVPNSIRCVYSIGEIKNVNVDSTHHIMPVGGKYDDVMIRVGHFLDESDEPGLFKINLSIERFFIS